MRVHQAWAIQYAVSFLDSANVDDHIVERAGDALIHSNDKEMMEKMGEDLANVIKDFLYAVDIEALCLVKEIGKHTLSQFRVSAFSVALCRARAPTQAS